MTSDLDTNGFHVQTETFRTPGGTMAYTDVGHGAPVVFLHGNPTSGHLYRHLIRALTPEFRCIAPDYLGFGRSEAPADFSYRPPAHATHVELLLDRLELSGLILVLHDWGGPIGLSYALRHPRQVRGLVLMNTWAWPLNHRPLIHLCSRLAGTRIGRVAVERLNAFARVGMPLAVGGSSRPRPDWLHAYADALNSPARRHACWAFARSLTGEAAWLRALWSHRSRLRNHPALLCWGMADPAFGNERTLHRWQSLFRRVDVRRRAPIGHYVPEEMGSELVPLVTSFLQSTTQERENE